MNVDEIRKELSNHLAYIQLMSSLDSGENNITNSLINSGFRNTIDFYQNSNDKELQAKGPLLIKTLEPMVNHYKTIAPLKTQLELIANDFITLCN